MNFIDVDGNTIPLYLLAAPGNPMIRDHKGKLPDFLKNFANNTYQDPKELNPFARLTIGISKLEDNYYLEYAFHRGWTENRLIPFNKKEGRRIVTDRIKFCVTNNIPYFRKDEDLRNFTIDQIVTSFVAEFMRSESNQLFALYPNQVIKSLVNAIHHLDKYEI